MDLQSIIKLIDTVSDSKLTSFSLEEGETKISFEKKANVATGIEQVVVTEATVASTPVSVSGSEKKTAAGDYVKSPLVGTFYQSSSPDSASFVAVGDTVKKGQTLGIIEAMKLMNEIESEYDGVVKEILVKNEQMVEYGQPLFIIG